MLNSTDIFTLIRRAEEQPINDAWLDELYTRHEYHVRGGLNYYRFLYYLTEWRKPQVCLEIGVEMGLASAHMARAASQYGGWAIGIDIQSHGVPRDEIPYTCGNYTYIIGNSTDPSVLKQVQDIVAEKGKIGVVYQDSSHHHQASCTEWATYSRLLDTNPAWLADDILPCFHDPLVDPPGKSMVTYFDSLPGTKIKVSDRLHYGNTMGILLP